MIIQSSRYGKIEYNTDEIVLFSEGLPGFESLTKFVIKEVEENDIFSILHSIENPEIALIITVPFNFRDDYEFEVKENLVKKLDIEDENQIQVYSIVTLNSEKSKITMNLKAPIVINKRSKVGMQFILIDYDFEVKYSLFKEN